MNFLSRNKVLAGVQGKGRGRMGECEPNNALFLSLTRGWHCLFFMFLELLLKAVWGGKKANSGFLLCHVLLISKSRTKVRPSGKAFACWALCSPVLCGQGSAQLQGGHIPTQTSQQADPMAVPITVAQPTCGLCC